MDRQKIRRAKLKARTDLNRNFFRTEDALIGLIFDGKEISSLDSIDEQGDKKTVLWRKEHIVLVSQSDERYITHVTTKRKTAKEITRAMVEYLEATDQLCTVNVLGTDSSGSVMIQR